MKNGKWIFSISVIFILIVCIAIVFMSRPRNDIESKERMILKQINTNETVMIYNAIVVDEYSLESFRVKDAEGYKKVGYAHFRIDKGGNDELINVVEADKITKKANGITLYEFSQLKAGDFPINTHLFVISNNPHLAKIEQIMDNGEIQIKEVTENPSISFFQYLDEKSKSQYNFYDKNENILR